MTDDQLWVSFKTAVGTGDAALLPNVFIEHRDLVHSLSIGETSAITIGRYLDTPALPEGKTFGELAEYAGLDLSDKKNMLYGALVISVTNSILATIEHPALINWELRAQRYPSAVGKCT